MKLLDKFLILIGVLPNPDIRPVEVITMNCGDVLLEGATVNMVPPNLADLRDKAAKLGYTGSENYDQIISFLGQKEVYPALDGPRSWRLFGPVSA